MLELHLARFARERTVHIEGEVAGDDRVWEDSGLAFDGPIELTLNAQEAGGGEIVVRGTARGTLRYECRRCLSPVRRDLRHEITLVYVPAELLENLDDGEVRPIPARASVLDLGSAAREEIVLSVDRFVVCRTECRGLCATCGANLNQEQCACAQDEPDPRWEVLRKLTNG